ncbi:MAG TPA: hypothetical protein VFR37_20950 [Longimicrobium sp.]|nr:hypothetical protein [Longimicrobium sp.]
MTSAQLNTAVAANGDGSRLLRLAASCPRCGSRPAVRFTPEVVQALAHHPPHARLATYQCQRRRCGAIFDLTARAFQQAS